MTEDELFARRPMGMRMAMVVRHFILGEVMSKVG